MKEYPSFVELRLLQELFKESNLTAAAAKLSLTTPTASHYLTHLRNIFDNRLFIKAKNGLVPTSRAEEVVEKVNAAVFALEALISQETFCLSKVSRTIRIGCVDNAPYSIFPGILHFILARAPGIQLKFEELKGNKFEKVQRSELDFFISPIVKSLPPGFKSLNLSKNEYCLLARTDHPLARTGEAVSDAEICRYPFIDIRVGEPQSSCRTLREEAFPRWKNARSLVISPYFLPFVPSLETCDCLLVAPRKTSEKLILRYGITEVKTRTPGKVQIPRLIWHEKTDKDPLLQWFRSSLLIVSTTDSMKKN